MGLWEGRKGRKALSWVLSALVWINADNVGCHHVSAVALIAGYCATPPVYAQWVRVLRNQIQKPLTGYHQVGYENVRYTGHLSDFNSSLGPVLPCQRSGIAGYGATPPVYMQWVRVLRNQIQKLLTGYRQVGNEDVRYTGRLSDLNSKLGSRVRN